MQQNGFLNNKRLRRILISILILVTGVPIIVFMVYRRVSNDPEKMMEVIKNEADMVFRNVEQTALRNGIDEWRLKAESAYLIEAQKKMVLEKPKVEFFFENGNNVFLTADKGIYKLDSKDIQVSGNVVVIQDSYTLKTKQMIYQYDKRQLFTQNSVQITGTRFDLTAGSMSIDLKSNQGLFAHGVTGVFNEVYSF